MRKSTILSIAAMAMLCWAGSNACAAELTVADGTATSEKCPITSYNNDVYVHHQILYPASMLEEMKGGSISALTFYASTVADKAIDGVYNVSLAVVNDDHFDGGWGGSYSYYDTELSAVYQGTIDGSQETVTLSFSSPFAYAEGSLLVDIRTESPGSNYADAYYAGAELEAAAEIHGNGYSALPTDPTGGSTFLPKTTFTYTEGSATGIENVQRDNVQSTKVIENGVMYLMYKGTMYNVQGSVVR